MECGNVTDVMVIILLLPVFVSINVFTASLVSAEITLLY